MHKTTLVLALMLAAGLRAAAITITIVFLSGWLAARAAGHLWLWASTNRYQGKFSSPKIRDQLPD